MFAPLSYPPTGGRRGRSRFSCHSRVLIVHNRNIGMVFLNMLKSAHDRVSSHNSIAACHTCLRFGRRPAGTIRDCRPTNPDRCPNGDIGSARANLDTRSSDANQYSHYKAGAHFDVGSAHSDRRTNLHARSVGSDGCPNHDASFRPRRLSSRPPRPRRRLQPPPRRRPPPRRQICRPLCPVPAFTLTILHNNNAESNLSAEGDFGGVARFASLIAALKEDARARSDGVLLLSAGNNSLSGPQYRASLERGELPYYDALAMDIMGFDASVIGHHELDFGPDSFADFVESFDSNTPFLGANLDVSAEPRLAALADAGRIAPSVVLDVGAEPVGIIGVTTPDISFISSPRAVIVNPDTLSAVRSEVDSLVSGGVNKIILISHLHSMEADMALLSGISNVDAVVSGGGRYLLANDDDVLIPGDEESIYGPYPIFTKDSLGVSVPIATVMGDYNYVGRLSLTFDSSGRVLWVDKVIRRSACGGRREPRRSASASRNPVQSGRAGRRFRRRAVRRSCRRGSGFARISISRHENYGD